MNAFKLRKQLKRRWRRWKRTAWMAVALMTITLLAGSGLSISSHIQRLLTTNFGEARAVMGLVEPEQQVTEKVQTVLQQLGADQERLTRVVLETRYICGVETEQLGRLTISQIKELLIQHPEWEPELKSNELVQVHQQVDDLSPVCKEKAYISVDAVGNLNLYEGRPTKEKVIRTFFQMDVGSLESSLPEGVLEQLQEGIRVQDKDEYNSVISTFSDYALDRAYEAAQPVQSGG